MFKCVCFIIALHIVIFSFGQETIRKFVQQNQIAISTISPDSCNYEDLKSIGNAIGNSMLVMLGEQDHGDAPTFLAKTRLIKYLHEQKGFNVLAFESDFFGLNDGWDHLPKQKALTDSFLKRNIFPLWSECNACQELLYNYIPDSYLKGNPLIISGFDNQIFLGYSSKYVYSKLDSVLRAVKAPITSEPNYATELLPLIKDWYKYSNDSSKYNSVLFYLSSIKKQLTNSLGENSIWIILADNLLQNNLWYKYEKTDKMKAAQLRDSIMANNLRWLFEVKFKNEKVIVWAANSHINKFSGHFPMASLNNFISMGSILLADTVLANKSYILGFTSLTGTAGRLGSKPYKLLRAKTNSFEQWIGPLNNYSFVDFKEFNSRYTGADETFNMSGLGHINHEAVWNKIFDGIFFIRDMYPCIQ
jgi:erythromycin esterase-like protein